MNKITYLLLMLAVVIVLPAGVYKSAGPPGCHAGEPPNYFDCTSCHSDFAINTGNANVLVDVGGADTGYIPGKTYNITVSVKKTGMLAAGFQFIALQDNNVNISPGSITLIQPSRTQKVDAGNPHLQGCGLLQKVWVEHTYQGITSNALGESVWKFDWKAPDNYVGNITFYTAALESNYNGDELGDYVYTKRISSPHVTTNINPLNDPLADVVLSPNPASSKMYIKTGVKGVQKIELLNVQGKLIRQFGNFLQSANTEITLDLNGINSGVYFVVLQGNEAITTRKIVIQN